MATKKKLLQAAAGSAGAGGPVTAADVFQMYSWNGDQTAKSIPVNIDLSSEEGAVWIKRYTGSAGSGNWGVYDTIRGAKKTLPFNLSNAEATENTALTAFNSTGFAIGTDDLVNGESGNKYISYTFKTQENFFDIVEYTGTGSVQNISHNLGYRPGMIWVKEKSGIGDWVVHHRNLDKSRYLRLNSDNSYVNDNTVWNDTAPTGTQFTVGTSTKTNNNGDTYIAYLFAHNEANNSPFAAGEFGINEDQDIIRCGEYYGSSGEQTINLGFEPQLIMLKSDSESEEWIIVDTLRGAHRETNGSATGPEISFNQSSNETSDGKISTYSRGFRLRGNELRTNYSGRNYLYCAVGWGTQIPTDADDVFDTKLSTGSGWGANGSVPYELITDISCRPYDMAIGRKRSSSTPLIATRKQGDAEFFFPSRDTGEGNANYGLVGDWDYTAELYTGDLVGISDSGSANVHHIWKRATGFFDVQTYEGNGTAGRGISHSLGVEPEMIWIKSRTAANAWAVYVKPVGNAYVMELASNNEASGSSAFNNTTPNSDTFNVGNDITVNSNGYEYVAMLFASVDGVSKIGSYTGNGSSQTINCGFQARFVIIKSYSHGTSWYVFDSERGINTGSDPVLLLDSEAAEVNNTDLIDVNANGFTINHDGAFGVNVSSNNYIFYAIA